jgi:hypothetical protein
MRPDLEVFHVGMVVRDIPVAMADLEFSLGLTWTPVEHRVITLRYRGEVVRTPISFTYSREGPVHLELLGAVAGTPWDELSPLHHVGTWAQDLRRGVADLEHGGMEMEVTYDDPSGGPVGFAYMTSTTGLRIELIDAGRREVMERWISGAGAFPDMPGN